LGSSVGAPGGWSRVISAPSPKWLLLITGNDRAGAHSYYGFNLQTGVLNEMGSANGMVLQTSFEGWLSDTQAIFWIVEPTGNGPSSLFLFDLTRSDSMQQLPFTVSPTQVRLDNPWRYVQLSDCTLTVYNVVTNVLNRHTLGEECGGVLGLDHS